VRDRADAGGSDGDFTGIGFGVGDELGHGFDAEALAHRQHLRRAPHGRERNDVARDVVGHGFERRNDRQRPDRSDQDRVAVLLAVEIDIGGVEAATTAAIFHHHRLAELAAQWLHDEARTRVARTAGCVGHDDADRSRRKVLRQGTGC